MIINYAVNIAKYYESYGANIYAMTLLIIAAFAFALMLSLSSHEMAHAYAAKINGDMTAVNAGRLSINPFRHFDVFGTLMMLLVGFGWAKPVPVNPANFNKYKKGMIDVALAGVITNLINAFLASLFVALFNLVNVPSIDNVLFYFYILVRYFLELTVLFNLNFFLFNLLPLYPLDGFRVLQTFLPPTNRFLNFLIRNSGYILIVLILLGYFSEMIFGVDVSPLTLYINYGRQGIYSLFNMLWRAIGLPVLPI